LVQARHIEHVSCKIVDIRRVLMRLKHLSGRPRTRKPVPANAVVRDSLAFSVHARAFLGLASIVFVSNSHAACQSEMRILADDLAGVKLTSAQSQLVADKVLQARRHCWVQHEEEAMALINSARRTAGLKETSGEFDWESVPLDSLEQAPSD
jgi:hypothetical protein